MEVGDLKLLCNLKKKGGVKYGLQFKYQEEKLEEKEGQIIEKSPVIV